MALGVVAAAVALDWPIPPVEVGPVDEPASATLPDVVLPDGQAGPVELPPLQAATGSLVVATGDGTVTSIDVDARDVVTRALPAVAPGDPPERLLAGERLVLYGGDTIYAMQPHPEAQPEPIVEPGGAWVFVPSGVPDRIWVRPGRTDGTIAPISQIDTLGTVLLGPTDSPGGNLAVGLRDLVVLQRNDQLIVWDPATDQIVDQVDGPVPMGTDGHRFAWCDTWCRQLHVTNPTTGTTQLVARVPEPAAFSGYAGRMSPDGRYLAAPLCTGTPGQDRCALVVLDLEQGLSQTVADGWVSHRAPAWSPDNRWVFAPLTDGRLAAYQPGNRQASVVPIGELPEPHGLGVVAADTAGTVLMPDVEGRTLADAQATLQAIDLEARPNESTEGGADSTDPDAVVANQMPAAGTLLDPGDVVGLRTALVTAELCAVFTRLPQRSGDAVDLAETDGYWQMLRQAQPLAPSTLADHIDDLLAHRDSGQPAASAPTRALDQVTVAHDACHTRRPAD